MSLLKGMLRPRNPLWYYLTFSDGTYRVLRHHMAYPSLGMLSLYIYILKFNVTVGRGM